MDITQEFTDRDTWLHWFVIASLAKIEVKGVVTECPRILTMQLNGVEINPLAAIKRMGEQFEYEVKKKAQELLKEKVFNIVVERELKIEALKEELEEAFTMDMFEGIYIDD